MPQYGYSGCSRDGPIAATDTKGCGKYGLQKRGGGGRKEKSNYCLNNAKTKTILIFPRWALLSHYRLLYFFILKIVNYKMHRQLLFINN